MSTIFCECHHCGAELVRRSAPSIKSKLHFCNRTCKGQYQREAKPVTEDWLRQKYLVEMLDCTQIAHIVKRDPKSVWNWMKDFGIPRRPRGSGTTTNRYVKGQRSTMYGKKHSEETKKKLSEIAKADGRVPYDPKVGSYMKGKKGEQTPNWKGGISPERIAFYGTPEWKSAAKKVKERDNHTCQICMKKKERGERFDIHHIVSFACVALRAEVSNLVYLCMKCHYWVHGKGNKFKIFIKEEVTA